ncbi:Cytoplasmic glyoxalase II [Arachnomyces sp. PD_36]|nr:Cytoplasmic glyoxalase II [Arachnomyces sp. PD_36]
MHIQSIPMWTGKGNNYAYLVTDEPSKDSVIVDPANPPEVSPVLKTEIDSGKINLKAIVNTHHHWDHAGGNEEILKQFGTLSVIGGKDCQFATKTPKHGEEFKIGDRISVKALHTPCHTQDSICYYLQDGDQRVVFTGDTLFIGGGIIPAHVLRSAWFTDILAGCGRFFEGNAEEMHKALNETLAALPDDTLVYPGHEYTKQNVKFCLSVSQSEPIKKLDTFATQNKETQGKFTIGDEKLHNVFMRVNDPEIQKATGKTSPVDVMAALREMKNNIQSLKTDKRSSVTAPGNPPPPKPGKRWRRKGRYVLCACWVWPAQQVLETEDAIVNIPFGIDSRKWAQFKRSNELLLRFTLNFTGLFCAWKLTNEHLFSIYPSSGPSMFPTLHFKGDAILVSKLHKYGKGVEVGDMVTIRNPGFLSAAAGKRVIGMPGDFVAKDEPLDTEVGRDEVMIQVSGGVWV